MSGKIGEILSDIRSQLPALFQNVIDNCKKVVEGFENHLKETESKAKLTLAAMTDKTLMPDDIYKRFREDQDRAFIKFKEEAQKKLRQISEKALVKIREQNKKSQEVVNEVVEFQQELKKRVSAHIDEFISEPQKMIAEFTSEVDAFYVKYSKLRKDVDKITKVLPKRMDTIYKELSDDVQKLEEQSNRSCDAMIEKYRRLIT